MSTSSPSTASSAPRSSSELTRLPALTATRPQALLLDVWGVLYDGRGPYDDANAFLAQVDVPTALATNASWLGPRVAEALVEAGLLPAWTTVLTAGDHARAAIPAGARYWFAGDDDNLAVVRDLPAERVHHLDHADLIVLTDPVDLDLRAALTRRLPLLCANPDRGFGGRPRAGAVAAAYEAMGGPVIWAGKPAPAFFRAALARLGVDHGLMVGDSLDTDVQGALAAGLDAVWVCRHGPPEVEAPGCLGWVDGLVWR